MNTIKTKIGFDIKPYVIQNISFREIFNHSLQFYGQILLLLAIVLSAGNWMYIKSVYHTQAKSLQLLQQEVLQRKCDHEQLIVAYKALIAEERLKTAIPVMNMKRPTSHEMIQLLQRSRS